MNSTTVPLLVILIFALVGAGLMLGGLFDGDGDEMGGGETCEEQTHEMPVRSPRATTRGAIETSRYTAAVDLPARAYRSDVAATVNGEAITVAEVRAALRRVGQPERHADQYFEALTLRFILDLVIDQALDRSGLVFYPLGGDDPCLRRIAFLRSSISDSVWPTAHEVRAYYDTHLKDEFSAVPKADIWYLAITVGSTATRTERGTKAFALAKAKRIKEELDTGADFATLARLHSPITADSGGHKGWHDRSSSLLKPIIDYAFDGEIGKVSDPIEFGAGWLLVRCADRREARVLPFAEVQGGITAHLHDAGLARAIHAEGLRFVREADIHPVEHKRALITLLSVRQNADALPLDLIPHTAHTLAPGWLPAQEAGAIRFHQPPNLDS
ncbi:MAG: peptidyl-prolyl cis-trans isomerase [Planctomycetota bacterium]|nr:peptidyl-prolyl cis-trans isomerase [Planctomycetota bacterium]